MGGFGFTEEQNLFRRTVRRFVQREMIPGSRERAKLEEPPRDLIKKMADLGLLSLTFPPEYGGQPADWVTVGVAHEELSKGDAPLAQLPGMVILHKMALELGPKDLQDQWLPAITRGEKLCCVALTEPECGSDAAAMRGRAVRDGDDYILNGEKTSITFGYFADAGHIYLKTDPTARARGVSCFWVPMDLPGISRSRFPDTGWKSTGRASITFEDVRVPVSYRLGEEGTGFYTVMKEFDFMRVCLALCALGSAWASLEEAMTYAKQRTAFGRPIAHFEGVSFKIAEHATLIEAARMLCYRTLWLRDQGLSHIKESAMCKWLGPKVAFEAIHDALLIHGNIGFSEEFPLEQRLRDMIGYEIGDGTAEIMKVIIAREMLGREFLPY